MTDKRIPVELTEAEARFIKDNKAIPVPVYERVVAALPPEYPEGTVAWVTDFCKKPGRTICTRLGDVWAIEVRESDGKIERWLNDHEVTKVEPLRVLANDEIAVKRDPDDGSIRGWHEVAEHARRAGHYHAARVVTAYAHALADALDAKGGAS